MRLLGRILPSIALFLSLYVPALAQISPGGGVNQSGTITIGNCTKWVGVGLIADAGGGCGGSGSPGGSNTQVQYNNAGSFGGITGATTNGTTLTLVAPILGTPTSVTLTNGTGLPISTGLTGAGAGVLTALGIAPGTTGSFSTQNGAITTNNCLKWGPGITDAGAVCGTGGSITFPQTVGGTTNSGGIPYFSNATTLSSSAALAANALVIGGGAGVAPATTTTGTGVLTALGVNVGSAGAFVTFNGALGTPSSATLTNATGLPVAGISGLGTGVATLLGAASSGTGALLGGTAPTMSSAVINTAATFGFITGSTQCLHVNTSGVLSGTGSDCGAASGISSITPGGGLVSGVTASCTQTAITTSGTLSGAECLNAQVGTSYAIVDGDRGKLVTGTNAASQAYSIAQAGTASAFANGWFTRVQDKGTGVLVITPTTSTICGNATLTIYPGQTQKITSDGTNYQCDGGTTGSLVISSQTGANYPFVSSNFGQLVNLSNASAQIPTIPQAGTTGFPAGWYTQACNQGAGTQTITPATSTIGGASTYVLPAASAAAPACVGIVSDGTNYQVAPDFFRFGSGVAAAAGSTLSAAGGLTSTIASGTSALGTGAISSATCATVVTTSATNTATTDAILWGFNGDPTAVTGYVPLVAGMLTIIAYPTSNNVNFKVCNNTNASVTPGAITLNWRTVR